MATITRVPITLTPEESEILCGILSAYARYNWDHARRTKSVSIRAYAEDQAVKARDLEDEIVRRRYRQC